MTTPQRVGIVGCGDVIGMYLPPNPEYAEFTYVACADIDPLRAVDVAAHQGLIALSVDDLFAVDFVDIVLNLTPPHAHAEVTRAALAAGKHVYPPRLVPDQLDCLR